MGESTRENALAWSNQQGQSCGADDIMLTARIAAEDLAPKHLNHQYIHIITQNAPEI